MTDNECYAVLEIEYGSNLASVKRAYRKLAFALHPDLNPDLPDAAKHFQKLNEAYVQLSKKLSVEYGSYKANSQEENISEKARQAAQKAYSKSKASQEEKSSSRTTENTERQEVLKDILNDPFARRVFEDIYSHINRNEQQEVIKKQEIISKKIPSSFSGVKRNKYTGQNKVFEKIKGWLRKQIDDEQILKLPAINVRPGARIRLDIQHGLRGDMQTVELTIPPAYKPGMTMRLKGMGKRIGNFAGDLYVKIEPESE